MKKRSYDFIGFAGAFIVLAAVVALWAGNQVRGGAEPAANEPSAVPPSSVASTNSQIALAEPTASSQVAASQPQEMGKTNLQTGNMPPAMGSSAGATTIAWQDSYENALQRARTEGKPLFVDFYTDWCGVCKRMDADVYTQSSVIAASQQFVCVRVNAEQRVDIAGAYGVKAYPTLVFVRANATGNLLLDSSAGGYDPQTFVQLLDQAQSRYRQAGTSSA